MSIKKSLEIVDSWFCDDDRYQNFLTNPIEEDIKTVPGIGLNASKVLEAEGINNTWNLIGLFCYKYNRDPEKFFEYINSFNNDSINNAYKKRIVKAITEKTAIMFGDY